MGGQMCDCSGNAVSICGSPSGKLKYTCLVCDYFDCDKSCGAECGNDGGCNGDCASDVDGRCCVASKVSPLYTCFCGCVLDSDCPGADPSKTNCCSSSGEKLMDYKCHKGCECATDSDCAWKDCGSYVAYCDDGVCTCRFSCETKDHCINGYCCKYEATGSPTDKVCVGKGTIVPSSGKSYLCDPPGWETSEKLEGQIKKSSSIIDLILSFFQNVLS